MKRIAKLTFWVSLVWAGIVWACRGFFPAVDGPPIVVWPLLLVGIGAAWWCWLTYREARPSQPYRPTEYRSPEVQRTSAGSDELFIEDADYRF